MARYIIEIRTYDNKRNFVSRYINTDETWPRAFLSIKNATPLDNLSDIAATMYDYGRAEMKDQNRNLAMPIRPRADRVLVHEWEAWM